MRQLDRSDMAPTLTNVVGVQVSGCTPNVHPDFVASCRGRVVQTEVEQEASKVLAATLHRGGEFSQVERGLLAFRSGPELRVP
ncbi:hypothetical protein ACFSVJ_31025, partial [Prauserella oleivorans]